MTIKEVEEIYATRGVNPLDEGCVLIECNLEQLKKWVKGWVREETKRSIRFRSKMCDLEFRFKIFDDGYALTVFDLENDVYLKEFNFPFTWIDMFFKMEGGQKP